MFAQRTTIRNVELNHALPATVNRPRGPPGTGTANLFAAASMPPPCLLRVSSGQPARARAPPPGRLRTGAPAGSAPLPDGRRTERSSVPRAPLARSLRLQVSLD